MGQYYIPVVISKYGWDKLYSWDYGSGLKLMEHSWLGNDFVNAVYTYITSNPSRVGWIGDYSDSKTAYYDYAWCDEETPYLKIEPDELFCNADGVVYGEGYLINHSKKEFIDMKQYVEQTGEDMWIINPLSLLTAIGNGQGGGDYRGDNQSMVGYWYMNELEFRMDGHPDDYSNITEDVYFSER